VEQITDFLVILTRNMKKRAIATPKVKGRKPITNPSLIPSIVKENGEFKSSKDYRNSKKIS